MPKTQIAYKDLKGEEFIFEVDGVISGGDEAKRRVRDHIKALAADQPYGTNEIIDDTLRHAGVDPDSVSVKSI